MKIVDVCAFFTPHGGGVKTYIQQKLRIGPELGHEIVILAPGQNHDVTHFGPRARIVTLPSPRFPLDRKYHYFDDQAALNAALDALAPDFVEVSSPWRSPAMVARWRGDVPRALVMHADPLSAYAYRWFEPILSRATIDRSFGTFWQHLREMGRQYDRVVCAHAELRDRLAEGGVANTALHPMGVDAGVFSPANRSTEVRAKLLALCGLPASASLLLGVGRLSSEKRWPLVIDAVAMASQRKPIGLVLLGEGNQRAAILRHAGGNPHVRLLSPERDRQRFATLLASADALIHGCEAETFCMAAAEARASGVPVVVPDRGGAADHAANGAGVTYRAGQASAAAAQILRILAQGGPKAPVPTPTMHDHFAALFADYETLRDRRRQAA